MIFKYKNSRIDMRYVVGIDINTELAIFREEVVEGIVRKHPIPLREPIKNITVTSERKGLSVTYELKGTQADEFLKCYDDFTAGELK